MCATFIFSRRSAPHSAVEAHDALLHIVVGSGLRKGTSFAPVFDLSKKAVGGSRLASTEGARIEAPQAPSNERRRRESRGAAGRRGGGVWGGGNPLPSRLGGLGERRELPQRGPGRRRKRIFSIFLGLILAYFRVTERLWQKEKCIFCPTFSMRLSDSKAVLATL